METNIVDLFAAVQEDEQNTLQATAEQAAEEELEQEELDTEESDEETEETDETEKKADTKPAKLSPYEECILAEMQKRAEQDEKLAAGLQSAEKTIHACFEYVRSRAKKKAVGGCAMIKDDEVFGWATHYYTEPKAVIDEELAPKKKDEPKGKKAAANKPAEPKKFTNPLLQSLVDKKGFKVTDDGAVEKNSKRFGALYNVKQQEDGTRTTTIERNGKKYCMTEFALF